MMKFKRVQLTITAFLLLLLSNAQPATNDAPVEMADTFYTEGKVFVVVVVVSVLVLGILFYLFLLDKKIKRLEKNLNNRTSK
jgi:uncharacterized integral membrane protein